MVSRPDTKKARAKRHKRVRGKVSGTAQCPRLCVFRSTNNIYAQLIDDVAGVTLAEETKRQQRLSASSSQSAPRKKTSLTLCSTEAVTFITAV